MIVMFEGKPMTNGEMQAIKRQRKEQRKREAEKAKLERREKREQERLKRISQKPWLDPRLSKAEKWRLQYALDEEFNIKQRLRASMRRKRQGAKMGDLIRAALIRGGRSYKFEDFVGYTTCDLRQHLEKQFTRGMTWAKFCNGKIHIDHIMPLSSFNLHDPEQLRAAWAITNLRPLWARDNLQKGAKSLFLL